MSTLTVMGYLDGVTYTVVADDTVDPTADRLRGIVTTADDEVLVALDNAVDQEVRLTSTGAAVTADMTTLRGELDGLVATTQVTSVVADPEGAMPEEYVEQADEEIGTTL